jgi:release factor glutamine methyltransferase
VSTLSLERPSGRVPGREDGWTVLNLILWSAHYLQEKGVPGARLDAEHLLAHTLELPRLQLYLQHDRPLQASELAAFKPRLLRRVRREPLQYILGSAPFRGLDLAVDRRVLIPRPETELLAGEVLAWAAGRADSELRALDLGTGSGALALALATEGSFAHILATDASEDAIEVASGNHAQYHDGAPVEFRAGSLYEPVGRGECFDVIVSNPPYIPSGDVEALQPEVRDWEPRRALVAGNDGMGVLSPLIAGAARHLAPGGLLALEVGAEQAAMVARRIGDTAAFGRVRIVADLAGRQRMVLANRLHRNENR